MYHYFSSLEINGLRYPKIFYFSKLFLSGSKKYVQQDKISKYAIVFFELDNNLNIIKEYDITDFGVLPYLHDITKSAWLRDINIINDELFLNIEIKNNINNEKFEHDNYLIKTNDMITYEIVKKYDTTDFMFKELKINNDQYIFSSQINYDPLDPNFFWGLYLFNIIKNNEYIQPVFDNIIDFNNDKGHILHNIVYSKYHKKYIVYFSIRHKVNTNIDDSGFIYKIYTAETQDMINYYNTQEVPFSLNNTKTKWLSYPHYFIHNGDEYIICNQDEYGKNKTPLVFKKQQTLENFVANKYNYNEPYNLHFITNQKYIYYDELNNKTGTRYDSIINNNLNLDEYSNYSPSCKYLFNVIEQLNITENDSIVDMGCGWGYVLTILNLFPFNKISGIEISKSDIQICNNNLHELNITNINTINDDVCNFTEYNHYNYYYFYNPFSVEIFEAIIKKINQNSYIIYLNIHDNEHKQLINNSFSFVKKYDGEDRDYSIYIKL